MKFDYVIVGGGSAGCVMAARLSEDADVSVCLIEAGGTGRGLFVRAPALVAGMMSDRTSTFSGGVSTISAWVKNSGTCNPAALNSCKL